MLRAVSAVYVRCNYTLITDYERDTAITGALMVCSHGDERCCIINVLFNYFSQYNRIYVALTSWYNL